MSKLQYNNHIYTLSQLIELRRLSPHYKEGDVVDLETGEETSIGNIDIWKEMYLSEILSQKDKDVVLSKKEKQDKIKLYEKKYSENRISKEELYELIKLKQGSKYMEINYENYFYLNVEKGKPDEISPSDYGRFIMLLDLMSYKNKIEHVSNGRKIKELDLMEKLEINTPKTLNNLISKLSKYGMLAKNGYGEKRFIHINPVYAKRKIKIDQTIYDLFRDDLKDYLNEYEIKYFEMSTGDEIIDATIEII